MQHEMSFHYILVRVADGYGLSSLMRFTKVVTCRQSWIVLANDICEGLLCSEHQTYFPYILACVADGSGLCLLMIFMGNPYMCIYRRLYKGVDAAKQSFPSVLPQ